MDEYYELYEGKMIRLMIFQASFREAMRCIGFCLTIGKSLDEESFWNILKNIDLGLIGDKK